MPQTAAFFIQPEINSFLDKKAAFFMNLLSYS